MRPLRLCRLFGIPVEAHPSFLVLPLLFGYWYGRDFGVDVGLRAAALVLLVFACVIGHELSHSLVAGRFGVKVPVIRLYLFGGVASLHHIPKRPLHEFMIAIAGPLFNFALAAALWVPFERAFGADTLARPGLHSWPATLANALWANPVLGLFNLIPAFPMDGGRMLRAALATRLKYGQATRISSNIGRFFAILMALFGALRQHWLLLIVAFYVYRSASNELAAVRYEEFLERRHEPTNG